VSRCIDVVDSSCSHVLGRQVQCGGRDDLQQLQCRLRVSSRVDIVDTLGCNLSRRDVQRVWRNELQQLQCGLCVPVLWRHERHRVAVCSGYIQLVGCSIVQQLQRRLRMSRCISVIDSSCSYVLGRQVQCVGRNELQQL
jgi:hypothetical protein